MAPLQRRMPTLKAVELVRVVVVARPSHNCLPSLTLSHLEHQNLQ